MLSCYNANTVSFFSKEGEKIFQIGKDKTGAATFDAVDIKVNNSVAVSSGWDSNICIAIIEIESLKVKTTISMDADMYGMTVRGKTIYYCTKNNGLKMLSLSDKSVSDIINSERSTVKYVVTSGDKLYYTFYSTCTVRCCDLHGIAQWICNGEGVLKGPRDISVDNDRTVYVVGCNSKNVVVISPDGQRHRQLLSSKDGLSCPFVLYFDKSINMLLVLNESKSAFLFDVTREHEKNSRILDAIL